MHRYLMVRGVTGKLVADPHRTARRYVGQRLKPKAPDAQAFEGNLVDAYEPATQVVLDHRDLRAAIKAGELEVIGEGVGRNEADAFPPSKAKKEPK